MSLQSTTLMSMMHEKMNWATQRQRVLAQNIANADTPDYVARDLQALSFKKTFKFGAETPKLVRTHANHATSPVPQGNYEMATRKAGYEISPDGNRVVLEEQMMKLNETNADHELAASLFKKYVGLYQIAIKGP